MTRRISRFLSVAAVLGLASITAGCWEAPPIETKQIGFRGVGMEQNINPRTAAALREANQPPEAQPPAAADGPRASQAYPNLQVLGDLSEDQFNRLMLSMSEWVAGEQGCAYCHNVENMADNSKYQHRVALRMIQMTRTINSTYSTHVGQVGVTCYTCHRGEAVPKYTFFSDSGPTGMQGGFLGARGGENIPTSSFRNARTTLPYDALTPLLSNPDRIRLSGSTVLKPGTMAEGKQRPVQDAELTSALMMHMSTSLGVNCTYCHNSRAFNAWESSPPTRVTAWHGLRMVRDVNANYVVPLGPNYPRERMGPNGDPAKVSCATCHQGQAEPLNGIAVLREYVAELGGARR